MVKFETNLWERLQLEITLPRNIQLDSIAQLLRIKDAACLTDEERRLLDFGYIMMTSQQGPMEIPVWDYRALDIEDNDSVRVTEMETADHEKLLSLMKSRRKWPSEQRSIDLMKKVQDARANN